MLITVSQILSLIPISRSTLYHRLKEDDFPKPIRIGRRIFWKEDDIHAYIKSKQGI
jgi:predicted DNA-binding transcriptional regulator AlpA